jgi:hypothetical protein
MTLLQVAAGKRTQLELEDSILHLLATATGSMLDNVELIATLDQSKTTWEEVNESLRVAEETARQIEAASAQYRPCSVRAAILYFVLNDLAGEPQVLCAVSHEHARGPFISYCASVAVGALASGSMPAILQSMQTSHMFRLLTCCYGATCLKRCAGIDPMYQFSLDAYNGLFLISIANSPKSDVLADRIKSLNDYHTYAVYKYAARGLFERHKLLLSLQMCVRILQAAGQVNAEEWQFFLRGGQVGKTANRKTVATARTAASAASSPLLLTCLNTRACTGR